MAGSEVRADFWMNEYITPWDIYAHGVTGVVVHQRTKFQEMYIVDTGAYGRALVLDGKWQSCCGDEFLYHEPLVQPAMLHHGSPKRVLILGGGEGATAREVLRWKGVKHVTMVDIDGEVVGACRAHLEEMHQGAFDDPRLEVVIDDAQNVLAGSGEPWDVIISDLSDPIEEGPSFKLFTKEYFESAKRVLAPGGALVVQAGSVAPPEMHMHVRLTRTLMTCFEHVAPYATFVPTFAAPWGFILASCQPINTRPDPDKIDGQLAAETSGGFRMFDGTTLLGLMQTPAHVRRAVEKETQVYTLEQPPKFFGTGVLGQTASTT